MAGVEWDAVRDDEPEADCRRPHERAGPVVADAGGPLDPAQPEALSRLFQGPGPGLRGGEIDHNLMLLMDFFGEEVSFCAVGCPSGE